jgi:hypothetical protein
MRGRGRQLVLCQSLSLQLPLTQLVHLLLLLLLLLLLGFSIGISLTPLLPSGLQLLLQRLHALLVLLLLLCVGCGSLCPLCFPRKLLLSHTCLFSLQLQLHGGDFGSGGRKCGGSLSQDSHLGGFFHRHRRRRSGALRSSERNSS